eukprot:TRINITY_DN866_c0_g1_i3.p1 TRINITY_DN866_c0_g1~~TRINITY_DN866_c0_g1_i3.p1  ORF type:complete len:527 (-),score=78.40 TRINITY_DN866_c0_g1_i3:162-1742(-)
MEVYKRVDKAATIAAPGRRTATTRTQDWELKPSENPLIPSTEITLEEEPLGKGGYGMVYRGECRGSTVAVKKLNPDHDWSRPDYQALIETEIRILVGYRHENLVSYMGACMEKDNFQLVMQLMDGNLESLISNRAKCPPLYDRLLIASQIAAGLNWLHCAKPAVIHRDLKLANILYKDINGHIQVKITDFGLSVLKHESDVSDGYRGTYTTAAPEVLKKHQFDQKADVFSFGTILWQLYYQDDPFSKLSNDQVLWQVIKYGLRPTISLDIKSTPLGHLMRACWKEDPTRRPTMSEVSKQLSGIVVDSVVDDPAAQQFWKRWFAESVLKTSVPVQAFVATVYHALGRSMPTDKGASSETCDLIAARAFKQLASNEGKHDEINLVWFGQMVKLFGPFPVEKGDSGMLDRMLEVRGLHCYHGSKSHEAASPLLAKRPGAYLVRLGTLPGTFAISRCDLAGVLHKVQIYRKGTSFYINEDELYSSMIVLLEAYRHSLQLNDPVRSPLKSLVRQQHTPSNYEDETDIISDN